MIALHTKNLFSSGLLAWAPHQEAPLSTLKARFDRFTKAGNASEEIYSGYREEILKGSGLEASRKLAGELRSQFKNLFVMGIGGSALGAKAILSALDFTLPIVERRKVIVADNLDPIDFAQRWSEINLEETCFVVISKAGGTLETISQFSFVLQELQKQKLSIKKHVVTITDPKTGSLRSWTEKHGVRSLEVPSSVGGRFSVFTPVGLLPLAFFGLPVEALLKGAQSFFEEKYVSKQELLQLGYRLAELETHGFHNLLFWPYSTKLKDVGAWFVQLWGESLGKQKSSSKSLGMAPLSAVGATDQHSILQYLVEGPNQVVNSFLKVKSFASTELKLQANSGEIPAEFASLQYARHKSFAEILNVEEMATSQVLAEKNRPVFEIELANLSAESVGALLAFWMDLTTATGCAMDINPYNQPGVELGKKLMRGLLEK